MPKKSRPAKPPRRPPPNPPVSAPNDYFEAEIIHGLEPFAVDELRHVRGGKSVVLPSADPEAVRFRYRGNVASLHTLRTVMAVYLVRHYPIPRPKSLLDRQQFQTLLSQINAVRQQKPRLPFRTFRISAAGHQSAVFQRIKQEIAANTGLTLAEDEADLLIRVRPAGASGQGWEVLCRLTPLPLSTRWWRAADMEGALNSTIAAAMARLTRPTPADRVLNLMCGSGTLLVERLLGRPAAAAGFDIDPAHLALAAGNLRSAGVAAELACADAADLPCADRRFNVLLADPPWGQLVGTHEAVRAVYPAMMREAARVAEPDARLVLVTNQIRLFEQTVADQRHLWRLEGMHKLVYKNTRPRIYLLRRVG